MVQAKRSWLPMAIFAASLAVMTPLAATTGARAATRPEAFQPETLVHLETLTRDWHRIRTVPIPDDFPGWSTGHAPDPGSNRDAITRLVTLTGIDQDGLAAIDALAALTGPADQRLGNLEKAAARGDVGSAVDLAKTWQKDPTDVGRKRALAWARLAAARGAWEGDELLLQMASDGRVPTPSSTEAATALVRAFTRGPDVGLLEGLHHFRSEAVEKAVKDFHLDVSHLPGGTYDYCPDLHMVPRDQVPEQIVAELLKRAELDQDVLALSCMDTLVMYDRGHSTVPYADTDETLRRVRPAILQEIMARGDPSEVAEPLLGLLVQPERTPADIAKGAVLALTYAAWNEDLSDGAKPSLHPEKRLRLAWYARALALLPTDAADALAAVLGAPRERLFSRIPLPYQHGTDGGRRSYAGLILAAEQAEVAASGLDGTLVLGTLTEAPDSIRIGDVITAFDGKPIQKPSELVAATSAGDPGSSHQFTVRRGATTVVVPVVLTPWSLGDDNPPFLA